MPDNLAVLPASIVVRPAIVPKRIPTEHYLTKDVKAKFGAFRLDGSNLDLRPDTASVLATAQTFDLDDRAAGRLGRRQNSVEAAVAPLPDANALEPVTEYLTKRGVPRGEHSTFYALDMRRRVPGKLVDREASRLPVRIRRQLGDLLTFEHEVERCVPALHRQLEELPVGIHPEAVFGDRVEDRVGGRAGR